MTDNMMDISIDIRESEQYKTVWQNLGGDTFNILYRTIYFAANMPSGMPDLEFSDVAVKAYKKFKCYKKWKIEDLNGAYGKRLKTPVGSVIAADLMAGWWIPFKYFMRLEEWNSLKGIKTRKQYLKKLVEICPEDADETALILWMKEHSGRDEDSCEKLLGFLSVVYTVGNMIPIITNFRPGSSLDGWDTKMMNIFDKSIKTPQAKAWRKYVKETFGSKTKFVKENLLGAYMDGKMPQRIWNPEISYRSASDKDWAEYFREMASRIQNRTKDIAEIKSIH